MSAPSTTDNRLAFAILGPLRVTRSGAVVALGGRQQRAILARLLVADAAGVSVEQLADMLWRERPPSGFVTTIQTYVFHLRKLLEPERGRGTPGEVLVTENGRYRLAIAPDMVDVALFKRAADAGQRLLAAGDAASAATELRRGLGLWRGEVLADLADFEFVGPFAARLNEQRLVAIEAEIDCELLEGHHATVIGELDELIAQHPLREQLYERQMLALYRAGRQSEALNSFDRLRGQLRDELGVDPGGPLQRLHQQVLTHDPSLDLAPVPSADGPDAGVTASPPLLTDTEPGSDRQGHRRRWRRQRRWVIASCAVVVAAAVAATTAVVVSQAPHSSQRTFPPNSVGVVDADGSLHNAVTVGQNPGGVAYGAGSIWVTNTSDGTVSRIDPRTRAVIQTVRVHAQPVGIAVSGEDVWVANSGDSSVSRINARENAAERGNQRDDHRDLAEERRGDCKHNKRANQHPRRVLRPVQDCIAEGRVARAWLRRIVRGERVSAGHADRLHRLARRAAHVPVAVERCPERPSTVDGPAATLIRERRRVSRTHAAVGCVGQRGPRLRKRLLGLNSLLEDVSDGASILITASGRLPNLDHAYGKPGATSFSPVRHNVCGLPKGCASRRVRRR